MTIPYAKKIYDSIHGFIRFSELEKELIDSYPFQRLHQIHQLGIAYLVYPGATHKRFEHSLGVMELAGRIFDLILSKYHSQPALPDADYWRVIVRLSALCHDLGHLPFSHVAEKALLGKKGHEKWSLKMIRSAYLAPIWEKLQKQFPGKKVVGDIIKISIGEKKLIELEPGLATFTAWERVISEVISGDFFGADRIDYLIRDAKSTGVSYGLFDYHQLIEMLCILPSLDGKGLALGVEQNGIESCEALLLARHFMHKRVYQYSSVKAYAFHLTRFMQAEFKGMEFEDLEDYLAFTDAEVLCTLFASARDPKAPGHFDASCLTVRAKRFHVEELPDSASEEELEKLAIPEGMIAWDFSSKKRPALPLTFPVLGHQGEVLDPSSCFEIAIRSKKRAFAFVSPDYFSALEKWLHK
jgi:uncharacterized protein